VNVVTLSTDASIEPIDIRRTVTYFSGLKCFAFFSRAFREQVIVREQLRAHLAR